MIYDVQYVIVGIISYLLLGILTASIAGTLSYLIWLFLERETAKFHIRVSMHFLRMVLACYLVPIIPFFVLCICERSETGYEYVTFSVIATIIFFVVVPVCVFTMVATLCKKYWDYRRKLYTCLDNVPIDDEEKLALLEKWCKKLKIHQKVHLSSNDYVTSPQILYYKGYQIIMPSYIMGNKDFSMALLHELVHLKHGDLITKQMASIAHVLHGFNPFAAKLRNKIERWAEVDCDFAVCEYGKGEFTRQEYYNCLLRLKLRSSEEKTIRDMCGLVENRKLVSFRVDMVHSITEKEMHTPVYGYLVVAFIPLMATFGSVELFRQINQKWIQDIVIYRHEGVDDSSLAANSEGLFEKAEVVYSEEQLLNREDSFDFTLNPNEIWVFDISEGNLSAIWIYTHSRHGRYSSGCIDNKGKILKRDSNNNFADWFDAGERTIKQVFVKSMDNKPVKIELLVGED